MDHYLSSPAAQEYLLHIHRIEDARGAVRAAELAEAVGVSQASVTSMLRKLSTEGFVHYEKHREFSLTPRGRRVSKAIAHRQEILERLLGALKLEPEIVRRDSAAIRPHLSQATITALHALADRLSSPLKPPASQ